MPRKFLHGVTVGWLVAFFRVKVVCTKENCLFSLDHNRCLMGFQQESSIWAALFQYALSSLLLGALIYPGPESCDLFCRQVVWLVE